MILFFNLIFLALGFPYYNCFVKKKEKKILGWKWQQIRVYLVSYPEMGLIIAYIASDVCYEIIVIVFLIFAPVVWENEVLQEGMHCVVFKKGFLLPLVISSFARCITLVCSLELSSSRNSILFFDPDGKLFHLFTLLGKSKVAKD